MWNCTVVKNDSTSKIDKLIFDFGNDVLLIADCKTKIITKFHGKISVNEYTDCFTIDGVNTLVKNLSDELTNKK